MFKSLTGRVLLAMALGACLGWLAPSWAVELKLLSDVFVRLVKMVIAPIVFLTIATGMGSLGDLKKVGRIGAKTLLYFEVVTTFALAIGLLVAWLTQPGVGIDVSHLHRAGMVSPAPEANAHHGLQAFILGMVPDSVVGAFAHGDMLPVLLFAVLFGAVLARQGSAGAAMTQTLTRLSHLFFGIIDLIMHLSPLAAMGAMAYTVGEFGVASLLSLGKLMLSVYATMGLFVFGVLGSIARLSGFSLLRLLRHIRRELLVVLGTSSSESVLPQLMLKLESAGCAKTVVGLVVPTGYSFNLDGTSIYLAMACMFIVQAYHVHLAWQQQLTTLVVLMLTSKGAAGVTGSGFVTLAATLAALPGHAVPPEGVALVVGVDRFLSEARALTNLVGNSVATVVLAKSEGEFTDRGVL